MTEKALGISRLGKELCGCDSLGILLGLGEVNGDVYFSVLAFGLPLKVLFDSVRSYIVGVDRELVEVIGCKLGILLVKTFKGGNDLGGSGADSTHDLCIEKIAVNHAVCVYDTVLISVGAHGVKDIDELVLGCLFCILGHLKYLKKLVCRICSVKLIDKLGLFGVVKKGANCCINSHFFSPFLTFVYILMVYLFLA